MKRRVLWLVALAGVVWLYLRRGARRPEPVEQVPPAAAADPAEELRRKLAAKEHVADTSVSHLAEPEPPPEPSAPVVSEELEARRREIHERARSAADEMRHTSSD